MILEAVTEFGEDAVAAYGIGTRIEQMIMLLTIGLNISQPLASPALILEPSSMRGSVKSTTFACFTGSV